MDSNHQPMEMGLLQSKLIPPQPGTKFIRRKEADALLADAECSTLVLICAPASYGKTTLLVHWREELIRRGYLVPWYSLTPADNNPATFLTHFLGGLEKVGCSIHLNSPPFEEDTERFEIPESTLIQILNHIANFDTNVTFFIDNIDFIDNPETCKFIENLLYNAPANLQFAMAARCASNIPIGRLSALGKVLKIGPNYLRLDYAETCEFVRSRLGATFSADICQVMHEITSGWSGALQLLTSEIQRTGTTSPIQPDDKHFRSVFIEFIDEDVLRSMSQDTINALTVLCIERSMPKSLFAELTQDLPLQSNLDELAKTDPLIETIDQGDYYQCPALLHHYFCNRLEAVDYKRVSALQKKAGEWFQKQGSIDKAIEHFLLADEFKKAITLLETHAQQLVVSGQSDRFLEWLEHLPPNELNKNLSLAIAQAWAWAMSYEYDRATAKINRLERERQKELTSSQHSEIFLVRAIIAVYSDGQETMHQLLKNKDAWPFPEAPFFQSIALDAKSWYYIQLGDFEQARCIQYPQDRWTEEQRSLLARLYGNLFIGLSHAVQGNVEEAELIYRKELAHTEARLGRGSMPACISSGFLIDVLYEKNHLDEAITLLSQRFDMVCNLSIPDALESAYINSAKSRFWLGDQEGAIEILLGMENIGRERGMVRILAAAWENLIWLKLRSNHLNGINLLQGRLESLSPNTIEPLANATQLFPYANLRANLSRARILVSQGAYSEAKKHLLQLYAIYEPTTRWRLQIQLAAMLANCLQLSGDLDGAIKAFLTACAKGNDLCLIRTITDEIEQLETLINTVKSLKSDLEATRKKPKKAALSPPPTLESALNTDKRHVTEINKREALSIEAFQIDLNYLDRLATVYQQNDEAPLSAATNHQLTPVNSSIQQHLDAPLTAREKQILTMIVQGLPNKYIANSLDVSMDTVKWHLKNLYKKLGVHDRTNANIKARRLSLVEF